MKNVKIRRFKQSDSEVIWTLHETGLRQMGAYVENHQLDSDLHSIVDIYLNNKGEFLVADFDEEIVGMGGLKKIDNGTAEIKRLRVDKTYQRKGIGKTLLAELIRSTKELGYKKLVADTTTKQIPAQRLLEKVGFTETRREQLRILKRVFYELNIE